ncbi:MAG: HipA domain-containing protein [Atopobiaceae bacterium]
MASVCHIFNSKDYAYVPFYEATGYGKLLETLAIAAKYSEPLLAELLKILAFDAIIANDDRHAGNYGFLRDNHTGEYVGLAPIFDNNRALFPTAMPADYGSSREKAAGMYPAGSDSTFGYLLKTRFTTDDSHRIAKKLLTFRFKQHPTYRFDQKRLDALSEMVQARAAFILDCPARDIEEIAGWLRQSEAAKGIDIGKVPLFVQKCTGTHVGDAMSKL